MTTHFFGKCSTPISFRVRDFSGGGSALAEQLDNPSVICRNFFEYAIELRKRFERNREYDLTDFKIHIGKNPHAFSKRGRAMYSTEFVLLTWLDHCRKV
jgi:hypothetical protein